MATFKNKRTGEVLTEEQYKAKFGKPVFSSSTSQSKPGYLDRVKGEVTSRFNEAVGSEVSSMEGSMNPFMAGANIAKNVSGILMSPVTQAPGLRQVGEGFSKAGQAIVDTKAGNKLTDTLANKFSPETLGTASDLVETGLNVAGVEGLSQAGAKGVSKVKTGVAATGEGLGKVSGYAKNVAGDVVPSSGRIIESQVAKALDLAPGDVSNIAKSTGNNVGEWIAENNLIKENKPLTQKAVKEFYETNYKAVRNEIAKVDKVKTYKQSQVPRYVDSLKQIQKVVKDTPGLEKVAAQIDNLLHKTEITLSDVQAVKELMDDHFSLYKVTGDVMDSVTKQGLANLRGELKTFIETEVKNTTGADIRKMNNDVSTARSLDDAITTRDPKGLTRGNLKVGDLGIFGIGFGTGGPLFGLALLFGKKLLESATVRLRIAKYMDSLNDAKKAQIKAELEAGRIPQEFNQFIKQKGSSEAKTPPALPQSSKKSP